MIDSKHYLDNYKTLKIGIGTIIENVEMLKFFP